jgi:ribosomal protein L7/L12
MRPAIYYTNELRRNLAEQESLDEAFAHLRNVGMTIIDCIVSVRALHGCTLEEAKRLVENLPAWSDYRKATDEFIRE